MAKKNPGVWLSYDGDQNFPQQISVHGSELSALRRAVEIGGRSVWVEHNQSLDDAIAGRKTAEGTIPGEEPLPIDDDKPPVSPAPKSDLDKPKRPSRAKTKPDEQPAELPTVEKLDG